MLKLLRINSRQRAIVALLVVVVSGWLARQALAYVEITYAFGRLVAESTHIMLLRVEQVDKEKNSIVFSKVQDVKGKHPTEVVKHNIGRGGFHPREWQAIMNWAEPGKTAVFFHNGGSSETCIGGYWYQAYPGGEWWNMSHGEPYLLRTYIGSPDKLAALVASVIAGQEVVVPCMVDGDKAAVMNGTARIQRLKASLKIQDHNQTRDFMGWGGDDLRRVSGMPGFTHMAEVSRVDPGARGVAITDLDKDGAADFCVYGNSKVSLLQLNGTSLNEISLPLTGGARSADWADFNKDGRPDLLLATPKGPRLLASGEKNFQDLSSGLPLESYYNNTASAWFDADADQRPDVLLANGFLGLRLYRNLGDAAAKVAEPKIGNWYYAGPFDNPGNRGFDTVYPPERGVDLAAEYVGKGSEPVTWKPGQFPDGQSHSFLPLLKPAHHSEVAIYLYRQFEFSGSAEMPISMGSDDTLTVWLNGEKLLSENTSRGVVPDQSKLTLKLRPGRNELLLKVCSGSGEFGFCFKADIPKNVSPPLFEDVSTSFGLGSDGLGGRLRGQHLAVADINADGRQDFLVAGDSGLLVLNTSKGLVEAKDSGIVLESSRSAPVWADLDGDKLPELLVPHSRGCRLFKNLGAGKFKDATAATGDLAKFAGSAASVACADIDRDGRLDVFVGCLNGPNRCYRNQGDGKFAEAGAALGLDQRVFNSAGLAIADINKDGAPDLLLANEGQQSIVLLGNPEKLGAAAKVAASR